MRRREIYYARRSAVELAAFALVFTFTGFLSAFGEDSAAPYDNPPAAAAIQVETAPEMDGNVIDDPAWGPAHLLAAER